MPSASGSSSDSDTSSKIDAPVASKVSKKVAAPAVVDKGKGKSKATISSDEDESSSEESGSDDEEKDDLGRAPAVIKVSKELRYQPPSNMLPLTIQQSASSFDYDRLLNNPNLELWVVRVPDNLKTRHLSNLTVSTSSASGSSSSRTTTGSLSTKTTDYTLKSTQKADSAEELASLRPLLPSKSKGGYFLAPRAPTTHLVLSPIPPLQPTSANPLSRYVPPVKPPRVQPVEKLKFRNKPFGFSKADGEDGEEDVTMVEVEGEKVEKTKKRKAAAVEEKAVEGEGEKKKSKKSKKDQAVVA